MPWPTALRVPMILPILGERLHLGDILVNHLIGGRCIPSANVFAFGGRAPRGPAGGAYSAPQTL